MNDKSEVEDLNNGWVIVNCSPEASKFISEGFDGKGEIELMAKNAKYPFSRLRIGQSFIVEFTIISPNTLNSIRTSATHHQIKTGKRFKVIRHAQYLCYEVVRIG